jgi:hypothetical protein
MYYYQTEEYEYFIHILLFLRQWGVIDNFFIVLKGGRVLCNGLIDAKIFLWDQ